MTIPQKEQCYILVKMLLIDANSILYLVKSSSNKKKVPREKKIITNLTPLAARSSKKAQGLKKSPYVFAHVFSLDAMYLGPTISAQQTIPPLPSQFNLPDKRSTIMAEVK